MTLFWKTLVGFSLVSWMANRDSHSSLFHSSVVSPIVRIGEMLPQWMLAQPELESSILNNTEAYMTTAEIVRNRGYPLEVHRVITKDGYILQLHRILLPFTNSTVKSRPVFLQHGLMASNHVWIINPTNNSLAYLLADQGFDVWMGNSRGNSNSREHLSLDPQQEHYWNYSWDEMGRYDIPASIDYVLNVTRQEKLAAYVGHSLGCTLFFIGAIHEPKLNSQVEMMIGLGATSSMAHLNNPFRYLALFVKPYHFLLRMTGATILHPNDGWSNAMLRLFCETSWFGVAVCKHLVFQIFGYSQSYYESTLFTIIGHYPDGGSVATMVQFLQNSNSGEAFHKFDYGSVENVKHYGSPKPAEYNLSLVSAPVYLVSGDDDPIATPEDVSWLATKIGNLKASIHIDGPFTHGDFIWSTRAAELVHLPLIKLLPNPFINIRC